MDNLAGYCTDRDGTFHFGGASPPLSPGTLDRLWDIKDVSALVYEAVPDFTVTDLGDLGPTYVLIVNYGDTDLDSAMTIFRSYLMGQSYCTKGECAVEDFVLGENSGKRINWQMESAGYLWYGRDFMFKRGAVLYHVSIQSIRRDNRKEYDYILESFAPGPPPESSDCTSEINMPTYNPSALFN